MLCLYDQQFSQKGFIALCTWLCINQFLVDYKLCESVLGCSWVCSSKNLAWNIYEVKQNMPVAKMESSAHLHLKLFFNLLYCLELYHLHNLWLFWMYFHVFLLFLREIDKIYTWHLYKECKYLHCLIECAMYILHNHAQGGYSGFQVTGMIERSQKSRPKKIPSASSKTQKNPWTKN